MKKGILEFDLDDFDAAESMKNALNADSMRNQIDSLYYEVFRKYTKYDAGEKMTKEELLETLIKETFDHFKDED